MSDFQAPKGVPDYLPPESAEFVAVRDGLLAAARLAGYGDVELPIFEDTALFARGCRRVHRRGLQGDVHLRRPRRAVGDAAPGGHRRGDARGDRARPGPRRRCRSSSATPGRSSATNVPQAGRYRQLQQVGVEAIGVDDPALDAEVIAVADDGFRSLGLDGFRLEITSLGDDTCRPRYREAAAAFPVRSRPRRGHPCRVPSSTRCGCSTTSGRTSGS